MRKLVVVTCNKDRWHFLIQCKSFAKFLKSCDIFITINERNTDDWLSWFNVHCKKYLEKFSYTINTRKDFNLPDLGQDGYADQQAIKLLYSEMIDNTYCVFDTKNWLIKSLSIEEVSKHKRYENSTTKYILFPKFFNSCLEMFGDFNVRNAETPYLLNSDIVNAMFKYFGGRAQFLKWFLNTELKNPSEFLVYDIFSQFFKLEDDISEGEQIHKTYWARDKVTDLDIEKVFNSDIKIFAIHRINLHQIDITRIESFYEN